MSSSCRTRARQAQGFSCRRSPIPLCGIVSVTRPEEASRRAGQLPRDLRPSLGLDVPFGPVVVHVISGVAGSPVLRLAIGRGQRSEKSQACRNGRRPPAAGRLSTAQPACQEPGEHHCSRHSRLRSCDSRRCAQCRWPPRDEVRTGCGTGHFGMTRPTRRVLPECGPRSEEIPYGHHQHRRPRPDPPMRNPAAQPTPPLLHHLSEPRYPGPPPAHRYDQRTLKHPPRKPPNRWHAEARTPLFSQTLRAKGTDRRDVLQPASKSISTRKRLADSANDPLASPPISAELRQPVDNCRERES